MSRDSRVLSPPSENADGIGYSTVPELVASLRSSFRPLEDFQKFPAAIEEKWGVEAGTAEALRKENEGLRAKLVALGEENERLRLRVASLESEREAREHGGAREREGRAEEVDSVLRENVELKRKNELLKSKVEGKYAELDLRVLELELDMAFLRSKDLLLPEGGGEMGVTREAKGSDKDDEDGGNGNGSQAGGSVSSSRKAGFRKGTRGGVLRGDGSPALKEVVESLDDD